MKKILSVLVAIVLLVGFCGSAFAYTNTVANVIGYGGGKGSGSLRSFTTINTNTGYAWTTGLAADTATTPGIEAGKIWVYGYEVNVIGNTAAYNIEGIASINDGGLLGLGNGNEDSYIIGESEATAALPVFKMFPQGILITRGITVRQGPGTCVTVYYVKQQP